MDFNPLLAIFVLLAATVALVPLAKAVGLGTVLGYLVAGVLVGPYGLGFISNSETIRAVSEYGVVMMLFLIGLELQPIELWRMRRSIMGLGLSQLLLTGLALTVVMGFFGMRWQAAVVVGLALAMSSTAIAMQTVAQRSMTRSRAGRSALAILLVQDVAVIAILAVIPILAAMPGSIAAAASKGAAEAAKVIDRPVDWETGLKIVLVFGLVLLAGRFLVRPFMRFVAQAGVREAFTALGLALVIGASLLMQWIGLSPALGAFLGGVLLADSEYRHELESDIEPFKGLLLGLFFISVGMSIAFSEIVAHPVEILMLVLGLIAVKIAVLYLIGVAFRMDQSDRTVLALLLSQAGEFAFVILQFGQNVGLIAGADRSILVVVVALSMATTPFLMLAFDRLMAPHLDSGAPGSGDPIEGGHRVIVLGYGRFGQIVTRMLRAQGFEMTLIDDDPAQIALVKRFGVKVFYGDGSRLDILRAAGAREAEMIVIAVAGRERITQIAELIRRHFPNVRIAARAVDRSHAHQLMAAGIEVFERETFRSALSLGAKALVALGYQQAEADRIAAEFERHDTKLLEESYEFRHDQDAYIGFIRQSSEMLDEVMRADREREAAARAARWPAPEGGAGSGADAQIPPHDAPAPGESEGTDIDNAAKARSE